MANGNTMPSSSSSKWLKGLLAVVVVLLLAAAALVASAYYTGWPKALDFFGPGEPPSLSTEGPTGQGLLQGVEGTTKVEEAFTRFDAGDLTKFNTVYPTGCDPAAATVISKGLHYYVVPVPVSFGRFVESIKPYPGENIVVIYYATGGDPILGLGGDGFPAAGFYGYPESHYSEWTALVNVDAEQMIPAYGTVIVLSTKNTETCMALVSEKPTAAQGALLANYMTDRSKLAEGWVLVPVGITKEALGWMTTSFADTIDSVWVMSGNEDEPFRELSLSGAFTDADIANGVIAWVHLNSVLDFKNPDVVVASGGGDGGGDVVVPPVEGCTPACVTGSSCTATAGDANGPVCRTSDDLKTLCGETKTPVSVTETTVGGTVVTSYKCVPNELVGLNEIKTVLLDSANKILYLGFNKAVPDGYSVGSVNAQVSRLGADFVEITGTSYAVVALPSLSGNFVAVHYGAALDIAVGDYVRVGYFVANTAVGADTEVDMTNTKGVVTVEKYEAVNEGGVLYLIQNFSVTDANNFTVTLNQIVPAGFDLDESNDVFIRPEADSSGSSDIWLATTTNGSTISMRSETPVVSGTKYFLNIYSQLLGSSPLIYEFTPDFGGGEVVTPAACDPACDSGSFCATWEGTGAYACYFDNDLQNTCATQDSGEPVKVQNSDGSYTVTCG